MHEKQPDHSKIYMGCEQLTCANRDSFTGNELTPKTLDSPDPVVLDTFKLPAEKEEPLPSSNFISFGGRLIASKES